MPNKIHHMTLKILAVFELKAEKKEKTITTNSATTVPCCLFILQHLLHNLICSGLFLAIKLFIKHFLLT